jgi:protein-disulfide isomerase
LGLWFYAVTGIVVLTGLRRDRDRFPRSPAVVLFIAYLFATAISMVLAVISAAVIKSFCFLCACLYALNLTGLILAWLAVRATGETIRQALATERSYWKVQRRYAFRFWITTLGPLVLLFVGSGVLVNSVDVCAAATEASKNRRPLQVVIFTDFQCPHCQELHHALLPVRDNPLVRVVLRHYPLEAECNPRVRRSRHQGACLQARAAICADAQGRVLEYSDRLFEAGPTETRGLVALAEAMGMDAARFGACLESDETTRALYRDVNTAIAENVRGTPTLFLNGRPLVGVPTPEDIRCLVGAGAGSAANEFKK